MDGFENKALDSDPKIIIKLNNRFIGVSVRQLAGFLLNDTRNGGPLSALVGPSVIEVPEGALLTGRQVLEIMGSPPDLPPENPG